MAAPPESVLARNLAAAFRDSCLIELEALKPGNVHRHAAGHDMTVAQFALSAEVAAPVIAAPGLRVGARILKAIEATHAAVGCNTNLGIVLLAAPLIAAVWRPEAGGLRDRLRAVLTALDRNDADQAYQAIRLAAPGGLGHSPTADVTERPEVTLRQAMELAAGRDRLARQYVTTYEDVFGLGLHRLREALAGGLSPEDAAAAVHLRYLASFPDSHILRKFGAATAEAVRGEAALIDRAQLWQGPRSDRMRRLLAFDSKLKSRRLNPGTSADLTVACLLVHRLDDMIPSPPSGS